MNTFKFLTQTNRIEYDGEWSQNAIQLVRGYGLGMFRSGQRVQHSGAEYVIVDTTYQRGDLAGAIVKVYPIADENVTITFWISIGRVTPFITDHSVVYRATI